MVPRNASVAVSACNLPSCMCVCGVRLTCDTSTNAQPSTYVRRPQSLCVTEPLYSHAKLTTHIKILCAEEISFASSSVRNSAGNERPRDCRWSHLRGADTSTGRATTLSCRFQLVVLGARAGHGPPATPPSSDESETASSPAAPLYSDPRYGGTVPPTNLRGRVFSRRLAFR